MNERRPKKRSNAVMQTTAARLSDEEPAALATCFGGLTPAQSLPLPARSL